MGRTGTEATRRSSFPPHLYPSLFAAEGHVLLVPCHFRSCPVRPPQVEPREGPTVHGGYSLGGCHVLGVVLVLRAMRYHRRITINNNNNNTTTAISNAFSRVPRSWGRRENQGMEVVSHPRVGSQVFLWLLRLGLVPVRLSAGGVLSVQMTCSASTGPPLLLRTVSERDGWASSPTADIGFREDQPCSS